METDCISFKTKNVVSGEELAEHLNRNKFLTSYGAEFKIKVAEERIA